MRISDWSSDVCSSDLPRGPDDRAYAGRHAATDIADLIEGRVLPDLRNGDFGQHSEIGKGRAAHIMIEHLTAQGEAARTIGHKALPLRATDRCAQVRFLTEARFAFPTFGRVERDHMIANFHGGHARSHFPYNPRALMAKDRRTNPPAILALHRVTI